MSYVLRFVSHAAQPFLNTQAGINYSSKPIRPQRVAARRQRELMVIIANEENGESAEWIDEEETNTFPIYSIKELFSSPSESA